MHCPVQQLESAKEGRRSAFGARTTAVAVEEADGKRSLTFVVCTFNTVTVVCVAENDKYYYYSTTTGCCCCSTDTAAKIRYCHSSGRSWMRHHRLAGERPDEVVTRLIFETA